MRNQPPVPVARYAMVAAMGLAALLLIMLLVRPFIFTFSSARDDANYPVAAASEIDAGAKLIDVVLTDSHGLLGEVRDGERVNLSVVAAAIPGGTGYTVVNAWSPVNDCPLTLGADRLVDCEGATWTYAGFAISGSERNLQSFPTAVRQGAVVVDFTAPGTP